MLTVSLGMQTRWGVQPQLDLPSRLHESLRCNLCFIHSRLPVRQTMINRSPRQVLNERAVAVMKRMSDKLTGRDFIGDGLPQSGESDSIASQVQRLISQATSHENLCQSYIGWCPFW